MEKLKIASGLICVFLGLAVAIFQAFQSHWLSSLAALILGPTVGLICLLGFIVSRESLLIQFLVGLAGFIGLVAIFVEHRAFDVRRTEAHASVLNSFARMELACPVMNTELREAQRRGILACALQNNSDLGSAAAELQKARALGPTLSLADSVHTAVKTPDSDLCAEALRSALPQCPAAFADVTESSKQLLLAPK